MRQPKCSLLQKSRFGCFGRIGRTYWGCTFFSRYYDLSNQRSPCNDLSNSDDSCTGPSTTSFPCALSFCSRLRLLLVGERFLAWERLSYAVSPMQNQQERQGSYGLAGLAPHASSPQHYRSLVNVGRPVCWLRNSILLHQSREHFTFPKGFLPQS